MDQEKWVKVSWTKGGSYLLDDWLWSWRIWMRPTSHSDEVYSRSIHPAKRGACLYAISFARSSFSSINAAIFPRPPFDNEKTDGVTGADVRACGNHLALDTNTDVYGRNVFCRDVVGRNENFLQLRNNLKESQRTSVRSTSYNIKHVILHWTKAAYWVKINKKVSFPRKTHGLESYFILAQ